MLIRSEICLMFLVGAAIGTILILVVQETAIQYAMAAALFFAMNVGAIDVYKRQRAHSSLAQKPISRKYGGKKLMKSNLRNEIKSYIVRQGMTMQLSLIHI